MNDLADRLALHSWTLESQPLPEMLSAAATAGYRAVELRHLDFQRCRDRGMSDDEIVALIEKSGLEVEIIGIENGLLYAEGKEQERLYESLERNCQLAITLGCKLLGTSSGQNKPTKDLDAVADSLRRAGRIVDRFGLRLALEANSRHPVMNSPSVSLKVVRDANHPACGLLLDAYHLECGGLGGRGFDFVPGELIWAFQYSDAPSPPERSAARRPLDRLPPGAGVINWREVHELICEKGYDGYWAYEAPNPAQWGRDPVEVAREGFRIVELVQ
jgi:sugar phosphate isomerase/epimerase